MRTISSETNASREGEKLNINDEERRADAASTNESRLLNIFSERRTKWILLLIVYNALVLCQLYAWANSTNSIGLRAYANTIIFNVFALIVCLISVWVSKNTSGVSKDVSTNERSRSYSSIGCSRYQKHETGLFVGNLESDSFEDTEALDLFSSSLTILGPEKYEVLALLVSSCLSLAAGSLIAIEAVRRINEQPLIHTGRLGSGALLGLFAHLTTVYGYRDVALDHVVCRALPCPTLRDYNPISGGNVLGAIVLLGTHLLVHYWDAHVADTAAAFAVVGLLLASMLPLAFYTASIIVQKLPHYMGEQLDKCLRDVLNIDGVLEIRNERFWTQSFGKLAGTIQVRVRRDANETRVLERVMTDLSRIVTTLTVREFRETRKTSDKETQHCTEYYINELLPNTGETKICRKTETRDEIDDIETLKIDDILGVEKEPAGTFLLAKTLSNDRRSTRYEQRGREKKNALAIYKCDLDFKNYFYDPNKRSNGKNLLIIGCTGNDDRFIDSAFRIG